MIGDYLRQLLLDCSKSTPPDNHRSFGPKYTVFGIRGLTTDTGRSCCGLFDLSSFDEVTRRLGQETNIVSDAPVQSYEILTEYHHPKSTPTAIESP